MADANRLVEAMKRAARDERESSKPVNVYFGEVVSKSPLEISVEQKMTLGERQLVLARSVTDYTVPMTVPGIGTVDCLVRSALEAGDGVILIRQQEGQKFIVIDRTGGES